MLLVGIAVKCIGLLAAGLRKKFSTHAVGVRNCCVNWFSICSVFILVRMSEILTLRMYQTLSEQA